MEGVPVGIRVFFCFGINHLSGIMLPSRCLANLKLDVIWPPAHLCACHFAESKGRKTARTLTGQSAVWRGPALNKQGMLYDNSKILVGVLQPKNRQNVVIANTFFAFGHVSAKTSSHWKGKNRN